MALAIQWYTFPVARNSQYFHQKHTYNSRPRGRIGAAAAVLYESSGRIWQRDGPRLVVAIYSRITLLCYRVECHQLICIISAADVIIASLVRYGVADGSSARAGPHVSCNECVYVEKCWSVKEPRYHYPNSAVSRRWLFVHNRELAASFPWIVVYSISVCEINQWGTPFRLSNCSFFNIIHILRLPLIWTQLNSQKKKMGIFGQRQNCIVSCSIITFLYAVFSIETLKGGFTSPFNQFAVSLFNYNFKCT